MFTYDSIPHIKTILAHTLTNFILLYMLSDDSPRAQPTVECSRDSQGGRGVPCLIQ